MLVKKLFEGVTTDQTSAELTYQNNSKVEYGVAQCQIQTGTGQVDIQGRADPSIGWVTIHSFTATGAERVTLFPFMRAVASSLAGGAVVDVRIIE